MIALSLILASAPAPCALLPKARLMLEELRTQEAIEAITPMRDDRRCSAKDRAQAWMLSAEAWFALGEDPSARFSVSEAFKLDALAKSADMVPEVLKDLIEDQRELQVGSVLQAQDRTGSLVDLSQALPLKIYIPHGKEPIIEARIDGVWEALKPRAVPGSEGRLFGAALPRRLMDADSVSYRYIIDGEKLGPFHRRTARERRLAVAKRGFGIWPWVGAGAAVGIGAAAVFLLSGEESGCTPGPQTACIELRVRP